jgi:hypothetical protein
MGKVSLFNESHQGWMFQEGPGRCGTLAVAFGTGLRSPLGPGTRVASKLVIFHIPDGSR